MRGAVTPDEDEGHFSPPLSTAADCHPVRGRAGLGRGWGAICDGGAALARPAVRVDHAEVVAEQWLDDLAQAGGRLNVFCR
jgi:hypothetical protein